MGGGMRDREGGEENGHKGESYIKSRGKRDVNGEKHIRVRLNTSPRERQ